MDLSQIISPEDIRSLSYEECEDLADDIRTKIIQTVSKNGGHLSSNLGIVEITLALHRVFHMPEDKIIFDVGHQTYTHKLLTGRYHEFHTLRTYGGLSGFPKCSESPYDCFEAGHASTAISAALGMARARDAKGEKHHVIAVVGDGALTGGMCYEALNDCGNTKTRLIVLLNDNEMSIAQNVGALSQHLSSLRASHGWNTTKSHVKKVLGKIPLVGKPVYRCMHGLSTMIKSVALNEGFFPALGFRYLGPINGNDLESVEGILRQAERLEEPVVIHCITKKGYGFNRAEKNAERFHGTPPFYLDEEKPSASAAGSKGNGEIATEELLKLAVQDRRIQFITAAMPLGTGTTAFREAYPQRYFDVGIAEEHGVTMCAGMAAGGLKPYFFVYSTFLQRGYDQVLHDVCMQRLPVTLMLDRAGIANEDGQSHQGLYDFAYLRHIPNMTVLAPANEEELRLMACASCGFDGPCSIRYPKSAVSLPDGYAVSSFTIGKWLTLREGTDAVILAVGSMVSTALRAADALAQDGVSLTVVNASTVKPLDAECLRRVFEMDRPIFTVEEHVRMAGFGSAVLEAASEMGFRPSVKLLAVDDCFVPHGDHAHLLRDTGLDDESVIRAISTELNREEPKNV